MTEFSVDLTALRSVIGDLSSFESTLTEKLAELDTAVDQLHLSWTGDSAGAHREAHDRWRAGAEEMHRAGVRMREAAQRAHTNYTAAGEANAQMWEQAR